ncbi:MAG: hypothetical protein WBO37_00010 [Gammaproteobacteria bacterium]
MRLLELRGNEVDADPRRAGLLNKPDRKPAMEAQRLKRPVKIKESPVDARVFPINAHPVEKPARRRPIDLEQLQRRIEELERRIQERIRNQSESAAAQPANQELAQLRQRMKLLERRVEGELWSAKQREHTLLEMLARPPFQTLVKQHCTRFLRTAPLATLRCLHSAWLAWWEDAKPMWWPRFAAAWHEALTRARH